MMRNWPQWTPDEWTRRIGARDHDAWQSIYDLCVFTCRSRINQKTHEEHEDLAGAAYLHVMSKLLDDHRVYAMRGFVVKTVLHFCYNVLELETNTSQLPEGVEHSPEFIAPPQPTVTIEEQQQLDDEADRVKMSERTALYQAINACLETLPDEDRTIIHLNQAGEKSATIATMLKMKVDTVYVRLHRAFKTKLRLCLAGRGFPIERIIRIMRQKGGSDV